MIQITRCKMPVKYTVWQLRNFVWNRTIWIRINNGYLVSFFDDIGDIVRELGISSYSLINNARVLHFQILGRLKIYAFRA